MSVFLTMARQPIIKLLTLLLLSSVFSSQLNAAEHHHENLKNQAKSSCQSSDIKCAKTVTSAFAPNGDLWRLWVNEQAMFFQISHNNGQTFGAQNRIEIAREKISARNENRPKIGFDDHQGVYLSWAMPREKKYTADIRFSYSPDYGQTFSVPITVNDDNLLAGHSFNEMQVRRNGNVSIVWLDGREALKLRQQGKKPIGSNLYFSQANVRNNQAFSTNRSIAQGTCVCCRIAMDFNANDQLAIFWRHIYGDNIREFALLTLTNDKVQPSPKQISYDHWKINGCPHQGGSISVDQNNRYHLVWFNHGDKGKGIFYARVNSAGEMLSKPLSVGDFSAQAAHPYIMQSGKNVDIVWTQFNGSEHQLWFQRSSDNGKTFVAAKQIASAAYGADRPFIVEKHGKHFVSWQRFQQGHWFSQL